MTGAIGAPDDSYHRPVMLAEVLEWLSLAPGKVVVDATIGGAGHAEAMLEAITPGGTLIGIDRDPDAIGASIARLDRAGMRVRLMRGRMGEIAALLAELGVEAVDAILADLGVSSFQLDTPSRGFGFRSDAPLDMRMDATAGESAADLTARLGEEELEQLIHDYGEERYAHAIARSIARRGGAKTTAELAETVAAAVPAKARHGRIHPATRTFQALRIAVNDELGELDRFLASAPGKLKAGGRIAVITYHSLEDRRAKQAFRAAAAGGGFSLPVRRVIRAGAEEVRENPRARSAKLRILERTRAEILR